MDNVSNYRVNTTTGGPTFLIFKQIGGAKGVSGDIFANQLIQVDDSQDLTIKINTPGGSVVEGFSIVSAIQSVPNRTIASIEGLAASMGSVIACACDYVKISDFGMILIHKPFAKGARGEVIETFQNSIMKIYTGKTGLSEDVINKMINANDGEGTLFDAETALNLGFVDEIVKTGKNKIEGVKNNFDLYNIFNSIINETDKMEKVTQLLELSNEVDENAIVAAIEGIKKGAKSDLDEAENEAVKSLAELENVTTELNDLKAKIEVSNKLRAESLISKGIEDGKISNDENIKAHWLNQALTDEGFEIVQNMFDSIKTSTHADITNVITSPVSQIEDHTKDWNLIDWQKKDSEGLAKMKNNNPDLYNQLYTSTYLKKS